MGERVTGTSIASITFSIKAEKSYQATETEIETKRGKQGNLRPLWDWIKLAEKREVDSKMETNRT